MLDQGLGCWRHEGIYGTYFFHIGGFGATKGDDTFGVSTGVMIFPDRTVALVLSNGESAGASEAMIRSYEGWWKPAKA